MQITELTIRRNSSYEANPGQFSGKVQLQGEHGEQVINLSPSSISKIFNIITDNVVDTAKHNAKLTQKACENAADEPLLLEQSNIPSNLTIEGA